MRRSSRADIRQLAEMRDTTWWGDWLTADRLMSLPREGSTITGMEIHLVLDAVEPPAGRLVARSAPADSDRSEDPTPIAFTGWLGLLRALSEVLKPLPTEPDTDETRSGQAVRGGQPTSDRSTRPGLA